MNKHVLRLSAVALMGLTLVACQATPTPIPTPTSVTTATSTPTSIATLPPTNTTTPMPTSTAMPVPTSTATSAPTYTATPAPTRTVTPRPSSKVDTRMGGSLTIRGVVRDDSGKTIPNVFVFLEVYGQAGGGSIGKFGDWGVYTDETGSYSFNNLQRFVRGHYEVWFNGRQEYGKAYENSGYYIQASQITGNIHVLDVTVHAVTGSVFSGVIQYEDSDGSIKGFYSPPFTKLEPGHLIELFRGNPDRIEYSIGSEYGRIAGGIIEWRGLAGGIYHLKFTYRRLDGVLVRCDSPAFEIPSKGTKRLEYTIRNCPPSAGVLP